MLEKNTREPHQSDAERLYQEAESRTNKDNVVCLIILAGVLLLCEILNEIGLFQVVPVVMRAGAACGIICYLAPAALLWRRLGIFAASGAGRSYRSWYKYFIILFAWLGTITACVTLTHHTVMVMAIPLAMVAQYRDTKNFFQ